MVHPLYIENGQVTLESDITAQSGGFAKAIIELQDMAARKMALDFAAKNGLERAGVSSVSSPYPVDKDGNVITTPDNAALYRYRLDVQITQRL